MLRRHPEDIQSSAHFSDSRVVKLNQMELKFGKIQFLLYDRLINTIHGRKQRIADSELEFLSRTLSRSAGECARPVSNELSPLAKRCLV